MLTNFSTVQNNRLAQRLSEAPLGRSASLDAAAERFERLLVAKIGADRTSNAIKAILNAPGFETAEGRLVAEIDASEPEITAPATLEPGAEPIPLTEPESAAAAPTVKAIDTAPSATRRRRDADIEAKARQGELPPAPDFSAPTHARFRAELAALGNWLGKPMPTACVLCRLTRSRPAPKR